MDVLFNNIATLKKYITISYSNGNSSLPTTQQAAEQDYLLPVLGPTLYNTVLAEAQTNPATPSALLDKVWAAAAYLCYYKELPFLYTRITDGGLKNITTENTQGAYKHQYYDVLKNTENEGLAALERLISFLYDNQSTYPAWAASDAYKKINKNLIRTGKDFATYYHILQPHRTFIALQPIMQGVEDNFIKTTIGAAFFEELKNKTAPNDDEKVVIESLRYAIANFTIQKSINKLNIGVKPEGLTVQLGGNDTKSEGEVSASVAQLSELKKETEIDGNTYLKAAVKYLNDTASVSLFATYFNSPYYKSPTTVKENINDTLPGVYAF